MRYRKRKVRRFGKEKNEKKAEIKVVHQSDEIATITTPHKSGY